MKKTRAISATLAVLAVILLLTLFFAEPKENAVWLVSPEFADAWEHVKTYMPESLSSWKIIEYDPADSVSKTQLPERLSGYIITAYNNVNSHIPVVYKSLSFRQDNESYIPLAVDPWMIFRRRTSPMVTLDFFNSKQTVEGTLLLPGAEKDAVWSLTAQLLQESPGIFNKNFDKWTETAGQLPGSGMFQPGAITYTWEDLWPKLFSNEAVYVYSPLSMIQQFQGSMISLLEADRFPDKENWNEYSLQVKILRAVPFGNNKKLRSADAWLRDEATQTELAGFIKWVPVNFKSKAVNPIAHAAQRAWTGSSYAWEVYYNNDDKNN